jgi:hypothetical protein
MNIIPLFEGYHITYYLASEISEEMGFFVSDNYFFSSFTNNDAGQNNNLNAKATKNTATDRASPTERDTCNQLNVSFAISKLGKEEKRFIAYFTSSICKYISQVCNYLESTDKIHNFNTLKESFH